eukprot:TRINITY_DN1495_c0_g1_i2.p1 TRINITY_DN1495_c0_g1~~TRINITY_DN1495_c0_g1_i2.p1  ORF type:complete len:641 (+),score=63.83 TRINITY_DN1495_c0_g1_i2:43-1923(+)
MRKKDRYDKRKDDVLDDRLQNGPLENRSCQDIFCCLLWICSIVTLIALFCYGVAEGDPTKLVEVFDVDSNRCGKTTGFEDYKYLYYMVPLPNYLYRGICVKECPQWPSSQSTPTTINCKTTTSQANCNYNSPLSVGADFSQLSTDMIDVSLDWNHTLIIYNTSLIFQKVCVPSAVSTISSSTINNAIEGSLKTLQKWASDIEVTWEIILATAGFALIVGFIYMYLLRYCVGCMTWGAILMYFALLGVIGWVYYKWAIDREDQAGSTVNEDDIKTNKIIAYCVWGWAGFSLLIFCCYYHKIRLAIAVLKTATAYVADVKTTLLIPPLNVIAVMIFWAWWVVGFLFIYTIAETEKSNTTSFSNTVRKEETNYCLIYYVFGGLWKNAFIMALCQFIIGSSVCIWYFSKGQGQTCHKPISRSLYRAFRYHLGSLAFGSLILAIVQFIRLVLTYIQKQCESSKLSENKLVQCVLRCAQCYVACLERFIEFLNKNAYIQIALSGKGFCGAAKDAMCLIIQNAGRFAVVHGIGQIFIFLGKIFICAFATLGGYLIITRVEKYDEALYSTLIPTVLMLILTYTIGCLFMTVYGMAVDAILHCFLLDEELAKKHGSTPQYTPEYLRDFLDQYVKK